jgi:glycosyltransferase involved in cell wall biosynthesis
MKRYPISVVMASFNGEKFIREQIQSILDQSLLPNEIVICDDNSTDKTVEVINSMNSPLIKLFVNNVSLGVVDNFKKAVSFSNPENMIAFADQDDIWLPNKIESLWNELLEINDEQFPALVYSDLSLIDEKGNIVNPSFWNQLSHDQHEHCLETLLFGNFITGLSIMMNKKMRAHFLMKPDNVILHDVWLALIAFTFGKVSRISSPLALYRQHTNNVNYNSTSRKLSKWEMRLLKFKMIFTKNDFLKSEFIITKTFYNFYIKELSNDDKVLFNKFMRLEKKPFLLKHIYLRIFFWGKWIKNPTI